MKPLLRYVASMAILMAAVWSMQNIANHTPQAHEAAMQASETCGSMSVRHLTRAQAFPLIPSYREWLRVTSLPPGQDEYVFLRPLPMCRYDEERGCWEPFTTEQHKCTDVERARIDGSL